MKEQPMGKVKIVFPQVFASVTKGEKVTEVEATTLAEAVNGLITKYGSPFQNRVLESSGKIRRLLNVYVNGKNIHHLKGLETSLTDGDEVSILPAVSGG